MRRHGPRTCPCGHPCGGRCCTNGKWLAIVCYYGHPRGILHREPCNILCGPATASGRGAVQETRRYEAVRTYEARSFIHLAVRLGWSHPPTGDTMCRCRET